MMPAGQAWPVPRCQMCSLAEASETLWSVNLGGRCLEGWSGGWGRRRVLLCLGCYREAIELRRKFEHGEHGAKS
jgi:hypothetical protein